jgi:hypothetical protein
MNARAEVDVHQVFIRVVHARILTSSELPHTHSAIHIHQFTFMMLSNSFLAFLASSLFISSVSATPLISPKVDSAASTLSAAENQAISFGTYTDRGCSGGQQDYLKADGSCHGLPGQGMEVWWFADTCRGRSSLSLSM